MLLIVAVVTSMAVLAAVAVHRDRNPLVPAAFFGVLWAGYVLATAVLFAPDPGAYRAGVVWVGLACLAVVVGSVSGNVAPIQTCARPQSVRLPALRAITLVFLAFSALELMLIFARAGFSPRRVLSFAVIAQISASNRSSFGYGDLEQGLIERVLFVFLYGAPLFGGMLFRARSGWGARLIGASTLLVAVLIPTLYGSRMGVLYGGSFWVAAYMSTHLFLSRPAPGAAWRFLARMASIAAVLLLGLSVASMIVRYWATADRSKPLLLLFADPFGFFPAFADWFGRDGWRVTDLKAGYRSFENLYDLAGIRVYGAGGVLADWPAVDVGFTSSNIYTVFRFLIEDFGFLGALLWLGGLGAVSARAFRGVMGGRRLAVPWLTICYSYILTSFSMSLFYYTTVTAGLVLFVAYFGALAWIDRVRPAGDPYTLA